MPENQTNYLLAPKAREDMENIWNYSFSEWGIDQANSYIDNITKSFEILASNPKAGSACNNIRVGYRKYPLISHSIYYREKKDGIEIMRILHDRMLVSHHL